MAYVDGGSGRCGSGGGDGLLLLLLFGAGGGGLGDLALVEGEGFLAAFGGGAT